MTVRDHQLQRHLREKLRDLRNHGFCVLENDLVLEGESMWGGYAVDDFNMRVVEHFDGKPFLMDEQPNGDLVIREPRTAQEMAQALVDARNQIAGARNEFAREAFDPEGMIVDRHKGSFNG